MKRRELLKQGGVLVVPLSGKQTNDYDTTERHLDWIRSRLRDYYGDFGPRPNVDRFHHYPDTKYRLLSKEAFFELADQFNARETQGQRWDCDEISREFRRYCLEESGTNMVGKVHNFSAEHTYNVVVTRDGDVFQWEPQHGIRADNYSKDKWAEKYNFDHGILYL